MVAATIQVYITETTVTVPIRVYLEVPLSVLGLRTTTKTLLRSICIINKMVSTSLQLPPIINYPFLLALSKTKVYTYEKSLCYPCIFPFIPCLVNLKF